MSKWFTCARCEETFESDMSIEDADQEAEALWGVKEASKSKNMDVICDDCFKAVVPKHMRVSQ